MSRPVSGAALQAMLSRETDQIFLVCLRLTHSSFATIRLVNNTEAITKSDGVYLPFPFQLSLPTDSDDQVPQITVQFDNIDNSIIQKIRLIDGRPACSFEVVLANTPNVIEAGPYNFQVLNIQYDASFVSCTLGFEEDILNQAIPKGIYTPTNSPGLFV